MGVHLPESWAAGTCREAPLVATNMRLLSINKGATHGFVDEEHCVRYAMEQRQAARQKPPLKLKEIWAIRIRLQLDHRTRELACSTLPSTANCAGVIWSRCASTMWSKAVTLPAVRLSCRRKHRDRCNSRSPSKRGMR